MAVRRNCAPAQHNARHGPVSTSDRRCDQGSNHGTSHGLPSPSTLATVEYRSAAKPPRPQPRILLNGLQRPSAARWYGLHHLVQGLWRRSPYHKFHNRAQSGEPMLYRGWSHDCGAGNFASAQTPRNPARGSSRSHLTCAFNLRDLRSSTLGLACTSLTHRMGRASNLRGHECASSSPVHEHGRHHAEAPAESSSE